LPFYEKEGITIDSIMTDEGREFYGRRRHPFRASLADLGIEHYHPERHTISSDGHVQRLKRILLKEFVKGCLSNRKDISWEYLENHLDSWLYNYNYVRPHFGYPNWGEPPYQRMRTALSERPAD
jgi:hypothetical protein